MSYKKIDMAGSCRYSNKQASLRQSRFSARESE